MKNRLAKAFILKTAFGLCARRGSAFGSAGILPAKRMLQIMRTIFAGKMPALPRKTSRSPIPKTVFRFIHVRLLVSLGTVHFYPVSSFCPRRLEARAT